MDNLPKNYDAWRTASPYDNEPEQYDPINFDKYKEIQNVLEYCDIDLDKFFSDNQTLLKVFDQVEYENNIENESQDNDIAELHYRLNSHLKFISNGIVDINTFQR